MLKIYNTFSKKKETIDVNTSKINVYVCGVTVYDYCHIGHARTFIFFDMFVRYLKFLKYKIVFIRNITDVDDKILLKANEIRQSFKNVASRFTLMMHSDIKKLNLLEPSFEPKASVFIYKILHLVLFLKEKNYAYISSNGDIYYSIRKNFDYGILSNRKISPSIVSSRNKNCNFKIDKRDFVIWKIDKLFKKWKFFNNYGRPGWHTECAAMSLYYSNTIDFHSGGIDLLFPHHENELAQMKVVKHLRFVKYWMHIGQLKINGKKMSKSLGNYLLLKDFLKKFNEEYLRFFFFLTSYRKSINYSDHTFKKIEKLFNSLYHALSFLKINNGPIDLSFKEKFLNKLNDDFNTAAAITVLFEILKNVKKISDVNNVQAQVLIRTIKYLGNIIGLFKYDPVLFLKKKLDIPLKIYNLVKKRHIAREKKNWKLADNIRQQIEGFGFSLRDDINTTFIEKS